MNEPTNQVFLEWPKHLKIKVAWALEEQNKIAQKLCSYQLFNNQFCWRIEILWCHFIVNPMHLVRGVDTYSPCQFLNPVKCTQTSKNHRKLS